MSKRRAMTVEECTHEGCDQVVHALHEHLAEHRASEQELGVEICCSGCGYHAVVWIVVRSNSTSGPWVPAMSGCECDSTERVNSLADITDEIYFDGAAAQAAARALNAEAAARS